MGDIGSAFHPSDAPQLNRTYPPPDNLPHAGRLEFSPEKAGLDVTPLNLEFPDGRRESKGLSPLSGKQSDDSSKKQYLLLYRYPLARTIS